MGTSIGDDGPMKNVQADPYGPAWTPLLGRAGDQTRSKRSAFDTFTHALTKSLTNFSLASSLA